MQTQIAPNLTRMLHDIAPAHRLSVMRALTRTPRVQGDWTTDEGDCFWVIATRQVNGISRGLFMNDPIGNSAKTFGVSHDRVKQVYREWDNLTPEQLRAWIASVRAEVQASVEAAHQYQLPVMVRRSVEAARELVGV